MKNQLQTAGQMVALAICLSSCATPNQSRDTETSDKINEDFSACLVLEISQTDDFTSSVETVVNGVLGACSQIKFKLFTNSAPLLSPSDRVLVLNMLENSMDQQATSYVLKRRRLYRIIQGEVAAVSAEDAFLIGGGYETGGWPGSTLEAAEKWYRRAAELDHSGAQLRLANLLVSRNELEESVEWLKKAAEGGEVDAAVFLHRAFLNVDRVDSANYYRGLAEQLGHVFQDKD